MREALFLHFDEELTSGSRIPCAYDGEDIAFWLHFYALFFDRVYIPANQFTDTTPATLSALRILDVDDPNSIIRMPDGPIKVLWDTSRFPTATFVELLRVTESDPYWCTARDTEAATAAARLCDDARLDVIRVDMTARLDPSESTRQLRADVFSRKANCKLTPSQCERLQECLRRLEERYGERSVYSRNFYYGAFGYGRSGALQDLARRFADITSEYRTLSDHFLTGVDYVSHSLKALFAGNALTKAEQRPCVVDVLIPDEYCRYILRPEKRGYSEIFAASTTSSGLPRKHPIRHAIDRSSIVHMTAPHFRTIKNSGEYRAFAEWMAKLAQQALYDSPTDRQLAEEALNAYLNRISSTLRPVMGPLRRAMTIGAHVKFDIAQLALVLLLSYVSPPGGTAAITKPVEILAKVCPGHTDLFDPVSSSDLPATFRLGSEIRVYM